MPLPESELRSFLAAIAANPGDDTPRLAFADWLQDHDDPRAPWVRDKTLWGWMAPDAGDPVPRVLAAMADPDHPLHRSAHYWVLRPVGSAAVPAVRAWVREAPDERFASVWNFLIDTRPPKLDSVKSLQQRIKTGAWYDVWEAVVDLGFHGPKAAPAVDLLLNLPEHDKWEEFYEEYDGDDPIRSARNRTLGEIGPKAKKAIPLLAGTGWHSPGAWEALAKLEPDPVEVLDHLNTDDDGDTRNGVRMVAELDPTKTGALSHAVRHHTGRIRYSAADILGEMGAAAADAVPALTEALFTTEWDREYARHHVVGALKAIGPAARSAVPALRRVLDEPEIPNGLKVEVGAALVALGEADEGWTATVDGLKGVPPTALGYWLRPVIGLAVECPQVVPHLFESLMSRTRAVREAAAEALASLAAPDRQPGESRLDWVPAFVAALADRWETVRVNAAIALGSIGERNAPVAEKVDADTRTAVIDALLAVVVDDGNGENTRAQAVFALGHWGDLPARAAEPLRRCVRAGGNVAKQANALLAKVRPE